MKQFLYTLATDQKQTKGSSIIQFPLWVLSLKYSFVVSLRTLFYHAGILKKHRLPCPVISVGNLTVGGVGKTPIVEYITRILQEKNIRVAILTRGYMENQASDDIQKSDEALMLEKELSGVPILVGSNRIKNAQNYLQHNQADIFLLDDGFQHIQLSRDLDIVAIDTTNPWGNGFLLPRGILRESKKALKRAQMFILTKADFGKENIPGLRDELKRICPEAMIIETNHQPGCFTDIRSEESIPLDQFCGDKVCAVSSIGTPATFMQTLDTLGTEVEKHFSFIDHHAYTRADVDRISKSCIDLRIATLITTEKDSVKLKEFLNVIPKQISVLSLKIKIVITQGEEQFLERINNLL